MYPKAHRKRINEEFSDSEEESYIKKHKCIKCKDLNAEWYYMPAGVDIVYCDGCVPRGCSCQTDDDGNDLKDEAGRLLPCCEYDYDVEGWLVND